jgi:hypothetical protein
MPVPPVRFTVRFLNAVPLDVEQVEVSGSGRTSRRLSTSRRRRVAQQNRLGPPPRRRLA